MSIQFLPEPVEHSAIHAFARSPGQMLAAMERGVVDYRIRLTRTFGNRGGKISGNIDGYRVGWEAAMAYMKTHQDQK